MTNSEKACFSRRQFLKRSGRFATMAATLSILPHHVVGLGADAPSERITLAGIGVGGIGNSQLADASKAGFKIVALCDVDHKYAKKTFDAYPDARTYVDFRELLDQEGDKIDAVYCGTPDHTHAIISRAALAAGKHLCCVKPLTRTIAECRKVVEAARKAGVATQVTMQPSTSESACRIRELLAAGAIGTVREVHAWSGRPVWPQGMVAYPSFTDPVPETLDWDLWLGPVEKIPFADQWPKDSPYPNMACDNWGTWGVYHPFNFRGWTAFGTGALGDMGCHRANLPYRALKLGTPSRVTASHSRFHSVAFPLASIVTYEYPARDEFPETRLVWYDGGLRPSAPVSWPGNMLPDEGVLYIGDEGIMFEDQILDPERAKRFQDVPKTIPRRGGVFPEWLEACKGGEAASANFEYAEAVTEFVLLGNLAIQTDSPIVYNRDTMTIQNNPEAEKLIYPDYQNGWTLD